MISISDQMAIVYIFLPGRGYVPAGRLRYDVAREACVFQYGKKYVRRREALPLDPVELPLSLDLERHTKPGENLFSALRDAAPDNWGRKILAIMAETHVQTLNEFDILTAGFTANKVGAIAFGPDPRSGPKSMAPWFEPTAFTRATADLDMIAEVVRKVDTVEDDELDNLRRELPPDEFLRALALSPSVGGARPKCLFSQNGTEFIVKFSRASDHWDEPAIEHATMTLAAKCGIQVSPTRIVPLKHGNCLFVQRFDRNLGGEPRHFISGYTLGALKEDGDWKSYQHLAQESRKYGDPKAGEQLFRRMVFNMICSNIDDHPRNQAFFVYRNHVELTPAYDIVPTSWEKRKSSSGYTLALGCGKMGTLASLDNALSDVEPFGLFMNEAERILDEMCQVCAGWRDHFKKQEIMTKDMEQLERRFILV